MGRGVGILVTAGFSRLALGTVPRMLRSVRLCLVFLLALLAVPVAAHAASVTVAGGTLTYNAGPGEANTAVIVKQQTTPVATVYFVGDQNPSVTVTASAAQGCLPTPPAFGLPKGYLCTVTIVTPITSLVENLGDGNDTGVINSGTRPRWNDQRGYGRRHPGRRQGERHFPRPRRDRQRRLRRHRRRQHHAHHASHRGAARGRLPTTTNGQAGENDSIFADVEGLTGGNGNDNLPATPGLTRSPARRPPARPRRSPASGH